MKTKKAITKLMSATLMRTGKKTALSDFEQACMFYIYQPKQPEALKKLKH